MTQTLHDIYIEYLGEQIAWDSRHTYWDLVNLMYEKEFVWFNPNDDDRIADGLDIRRQWVEHVLEAIGPPVDVNQPCSFLEVLIGLSRRMEFNMGESAEGWAWQLLINLGLDRMRDPLSKYKQRKADDIMESVIFLNYERDGTGGFFPLAHPRKDQRKVDLWYQMHWYIAEIHPEY